MHDFLHVDQNNFEAEVLKSDQPVVVEFGAVWCQPCKQLEPELLKLGQEWGDKVRLAKLDVDENTDLTMQYQVMGVPTVILFVHGKPAVRFTGYMSRDRILGKFKQHLN